MLGQGLRSTSRCVAVCGAAAVQPSTSGKLRAACLTRRPPVQRCSASFFKSCVREPRFLRSLCFLCPLCLNVGPSVLFYFIFCLLYPSFCLLASLSGGFLPFYLWPFTTDMLLENSFFAFFLSFFFPFSLSFFC